MSYRDVNTQAAIESAASTPRGLELARADLVSMRDRIGAERENLAYAALTTPGGTAAKRLTAATAQAASITLEIENTFSALTEARRRLASAQAAAQRQALIDGATEATGIADEMARQAELVGEGIVATIARIQKYSELAQ